MAAAFIRAHKTEFCVGVMWWVPRVHFSGLYALLKEPLARRALDDAHQPELIQ
jgi:putative transposase